MKRYLLEMEMPNYTMAKFRQEKFHKVVLLPLPFRLMLAPLFQILPLLTILAI